MSLNSLLNFRRRRSLKIYSMEMESIIDVIKEVIDSGGEYRLYPSGKSMLPFIREKMDSVILVKPEFPLKKLDIPFYIRDDGKYVLHRIIAKEDDCYICCGDNQLSLEYNVREDMIFAVVKYIYRGNKKIPVDCFSFKLYSLVWSVIYIRKVVWKLRGYVRWIKVTKKL